MARMRFGKYSFEAKNLDKVLYPEAGLTKRAVIDYYARIAENLLPYAQGRPVTLRRFPDGIAENGFYQQDAKDHFPDWLETVRVDKSGGTVEHVVLKRTADLAWLAEQGTVELHLWQADTGDLRRPDVLLFDLDPPVDGDFGMVRRAALDLRELLSRLGLTPYVKTTGSKGLHVVSPIKPELGFDDVREFARVACERLADENPDAYTLEQRKDKRRGRVFLDYLRNSYGITAVAPYSLRARPHAPVATPLAWDEVKRTSLAPDAYGVRNIFRRLGQKEGPWRGMRRHAASVERAVSRLDRL